MDGERRQSYCPAATSAAGSVKIAGLWKRSQGLHRFTRPNFRHRVFILTDQALSYYSGTLDKIGHLKGRIPIESVKAVEFVEQGALGLAHTLQVIYQSKKHGHVTLYITGRDLEECTEWISAIRQACYFNQEMLMHYHPGAYTKNGWSCCKQRHKPTLGCQPTFYLLTRSSSRYAQMRRAQRSSASPRPYSTPLRTHNSTHNNDSGLTDATGVSGNGQTQNTRSTSCDNLHVIDQSFLHLPDARIASSCYTLTAVSDSPSHDSHVTPKRQEKEAASAPLKRKEFPVSFQLSDDIEKGQPGHRCYGSLDRRPRRHSPRHHHHQHQVAPAPTTPVALVSHRHRSAECSNEATPSPLRKTTLYVGGSRCSSASGDQAFEYDFQTWPRKASIEPRISNTDPEVIHV